MKTLRSRFRLISLVLLCAFLLTLLLCAGMTGKLPAALPGSTSSPVPEAGTSAPAVESPDLSGSPSPRPDLTTPEPSEGFDTYGL